MVILNDHLSTIILVTPLLCYVAYAMVTGRGRRRRRETNENENDSNNTTEQQSDRNKRTRVTLGSDDLQDLESHPRNNAGNDTAADGKGGGEGNKENENEEDGCSNDEGPKLPPGYKEHTGPFNVPPNFIPFIFKIFVSNAAEVELAEMLIRNGDIILLIATFVYVVAWPVLHAQLWAMYLHGKLCPVWLSRGSITSAVAYDRTRGILLKNAIIGPMLRFLGETFDGVKVWVSASLSGRHPFHFDKFKDVWRMIISLGCVNKVMWFRCNRTGRMFGILVPHGAAIILSEYGAGVISEIEHKVEGGEDCWTLSFQMKLHNTEEMV